MSTRKERVVEQTIVIQASPGAVWKALTDAEALTRWFPLEARVSPGIGGSIWMSWGDIYEGDAAIEAWEPGLHLRARFPAEENNALATDYYLQGEGGATVLRVVTSGFGAGEDWDHSYEGVRFGWAFELEGLRHYLEHHRGVERIIGRVQRKLEWDRANMWDRIMAPDGFFVSGKGAPLKAGRYSATMGGEEFTGTILNNTPPTQVVGTIQELNNAVFRIELESHGPGDLWVWVSTYGVAEERVRELEHVWAEKIDLIFSG
jgi:uncharacterized protein YndB with AHSA1/START domain